MLQESFDRILIVATAWAVLGAIVGSFLATLILRWPEGRSPLRGRSVCDGCGNTIPARDLVPMLSFVMLRGRARCCGQKIYPLHPLVELGAALIGIVSAVVLGEQAWQAALFGWLLLALALLDLRHFWLPDALTAALAVAGLLLAFAVPFPRFFDRLIGMAAGYVCLALIGWLYRRLRGHDGLGGGDPKLLAGIGAWTGWAALPAVLLIAALLGLAAAVVTVFFGGPMTRQTRLPLGTLLAIAAWPLLLWQQY